MHVSSAEPDQQSLAALMISRAQSDIGGFFDLAVAIAALAMDDRRGEQTQALMKRYRSLCSMYEMLRSQVDPDGAWQASEEVDVGLERTLLLGGVDPQGDYDRALLGRVRQAFAALRDDLEALRRREAQSQGAAILSGGGRRVVLQ